MIRITIADHVLNITLVERAIPIIPGKFTRSSCSPNKSNDDKEPILNNAVSLTTANTPIVNIVA